MDIHTGDCLNFSYAVPCVRSYLRDVSGQHADCIPVMRPASDTGDCARVVIGRQGNKSPHPFCVPGGSDTPPTGKCHLDSVAYSWYFLFFFLYK